MDLVIISVAGLLFGSFISNTLWQLHTGSVLAKDKLAAKLWTGQNRSICGQCGHRLGFRDLIPVFSWLFLKGRCRYCQAKLSAQYPLVEVVTATLFTLSYVALLLSGSYGYLEFGVWALTLSSLIILGVYDLRWMILPDGPMLAALGGITLLTLLEGFAGDWWAMALKVLAGFIFGGAFYGLHMAGKGRWMGGGDVKLAFLMGLLLGISKTLVAMFIAFNLAALVSITLMMFRRLKRKDMIPFGPFLILGTVVSALYGSQLLDAYINLFTRY